MAKKIEEVVVMDEFGDFDSFEEMDEETEEKELEHFYILPSNVTLTDAVTSYFKDIANIRILSDDEVSRLSDAIQKGLSAEKELEKDPTNEQFKKEVEDGEIAQNTILTHNYKLVVKVAKDYAKYLPKDLELMDLILEGNSCVKHAAIKFDANKGYRFSTYATWWIRQSISRLISENKGAVRIPNHINEKHTKIVKAENELTQELGRAPSNLEIAEKLGFTEKEVTSIKEYYQISKSLDEVVGDDEDATLQNIIPDTSYNPLEALEREKALEEIEKQINNLPEEEKMVMKHILGLGVEKKNLEEIAKLNHKSSERIRQIKESAKKKLQKQLDPAIIAMIFGRK